MNIIVVKNDGSWYTRPDTTLEREPKDFYIPDGMMAATAASFRYIRIIKAGKAIQPKFAGRYYDSFGSGVILYGKGTDGALHPYIDGSTIILPADESSDVLDDEAAGLIAAALQNVTASMSVRIGDIVLFEDEEMTDFNCGESLKLYSDDDSEPVLDFNIC